MHAKNFRRILSLFLALALLGTLLVTPVSAFSGKANAKETLSEPIATNAVNAAIVIDDDPTGGYEGDYVVIYNPSTSSSTSYSTGTMTGLIKTSVNTNNSMSQLNTEGISYRIDIDAQMAKLAETAKVERPTEEVQTSYNVGATKTFKIYASYSPTGSGSVQFKCLYVGEHCYIWTPTSTASNVYPLDQIDSTYAKKAADEFDSKFNLMQSSFGDHSNGTSGDGKLHILYYNIDEGWNGSGGYTAGFFWGTDLSNNGLPMLNIDTYPSVYYKRSNGTEYKNISATFNTTVHEYQHLINYSNTPRMNSWLNESFSAAAEEICYPGSSVVSRIQSWEDYYYSDYNNWLNPPTEVAYNSSYTMHNGASMYSWNQNITDILALYGQVSLFAQYLFSRYGNGIYKEISANFTGYDSEPNAITAATGMNCSDLARDFRIALTANAAQNVYNGRFGFKVQNGYNPASYNNVQNPYSLLVPVVFTGSSCSIKGGGAITVKPVNGVYNPPSGASANLKYYGIKLGNAAPSYTVTAVSNNTSYGTVSVNGNTITATPKTGYYAAGYTVTSGSATVTQNGNTFTVNPTSNCTVRINFAAKSTVTITCMANGSTYTTLTAYAGESFNLPSNATYVSGYTFVGWSNSTVAETTTAPSYFAPGASVSASSNATVYAVYTRTTSTGTGNAYTLLTAAPSDWAGNYVITYGTASSSMYLMKGVTVSSNPTTIESSSNAVTFANSGATLSNNTLTNVGNAYIFTMAKHGNYYSLQNVSTGTYVGMNSNTYLAGYTTYTSTYCDWTPGVGSNASSMKSAASGSYPYLSFTTGSKYFWSGSSANTSVRLWKQSGTTTTYYTTSPTVNTHTHSYGNWYSNNNGTHSRTCSCGDKQTANCTYTDVVTPPTTTSQGYTTHTCTVCGYSYKDNYTDPVAPTTYYTVTFSVPSGVTAPSSKTVEANTYVTLPTASAPSGYTFLGWVTSAVNNTTTMPNYLTGSYKVTGNVTLRALYSYTSTSGGSGTTYTLVGSTPSNWAGNYVITYGTNTSSLYVLKGLSGNTKYESSSCGGAVLLSNTGMTYSNGTLTGATAPYIFKVAADGSYYTIQNTSTGTYLGIYNYYLYSRSSYSSSYCRWTLSCSNNNVTVKNAAGGNYPYLAFYTSSKYFMSSSSVPSGLYFWKQTTTGGSSTTYYTTG